MDEGTLLVFNAYNEIKLEKAEVHSNQTPDLSKLKPVLFWELISKKLMG